MDSYFGGARIPSLESIVNILSISRTKRLREEAGITNINGFEGIERIGIPHKYIHIEIGGKYFSCLSSDRKTVYTTEGRLLFECTDFKYCKQGMFLVGNKKEVRVIKDTDRDDFGYALYNEENKLTEPLYKLHGMNENFNEAGFLILSVFGNYNKHVIINKLGEVLLHDESYKSPYLRGVIAIVDDSHINLLTGNTICKRSYSSGMDTDEFMFVQVDSNCIYQINKNTGDFIIHGKIKEVEKPKSSEPKVVKQIEPKIPEQRRNDQCNCGSGKKYKNCCIK